MTRFLRRWWCSMTTHRWEHIGERYLGTWMLGLLWKCKHCRRELVLPEGVDPRA